MISTSGVVGERRSNNSMQRTALRAAADTERWSESEDSGTARHPPRLTVRVFGTEKPPHNDRLQRTVRCAARR